MVEVPGPSVMAGGDIRSATTLMYRQVLVKYRIAQRRRLSNDKTYLALLSF